MQARASRSHAPNTTVAHAPSANARLTHPTGRGSSTDATPQSGAPPGGGGYHPPLSPPGAQSRPMAETGSPARRRLPDRHQTARTDKRTWGGRWRLPSDGHPPPQCRRGRPYRKEKNKEQDCHGPSLPRLNPPTDMLAPVIAHADAPRRWKRATWRRLITTRRPGNNQSVAPCAAHASVSFTWTPAACQVHAAGKSKKGPKARACVGWPSTAADIAVSSILPDGVGTKRNHDRLSAIHSAGLRPAKLSRLHYTMHT